MKRGRSSLKARRGSICWELGENQKRKGLEIRTLLKLDLNLGLLHCCCATHAAVCKNKSHKEIETSLL